MQHLNIGHLATCMSSYMAIHLTGVWYWFDSALCSLHLFH